MKLRIKFKKYGTVRFIGHLDVMRFFQKAIRRAEIDVAYSGGYSPHQIMSFAAPLGVGLESNGEYMDIEVHSLTSCQDIKNKLNAVSVPGIEVVSVKVLPEGAGNAMASVSSASYTIRFREGRVPSLFEKEESAVQSLLDDFLAQDRIFITKEGKNGPRMVDIKPGIFKLHWQNQSLYMHVDASSAGNIKPIQVISSLQTFYQEKLALHQQELAENALLITREETYAADFVPLDAVGMADGEWQK